MSKHSEPDKNAIKGDSRGQFARSQADRRNSGMTSAEPRVLSKEGQAKTVHEQDAHGRDVDDDQSTPRNEIGTAE